MEKDKIIEAVAWALCSHQYPCSSMVDEVMNPNNPMFEKMTAARLNATGQTERDWYLEKAEKAIAAYRDAVREWCRTPPAYVEFYPFDAVFVDKPEEGA